MNTVYNFTDDMEIDVGKPCDFSFKKIKEMEALPEENTPRGVRVGGTPTRNIETRKFLSRSIWLNNNKLTSLKGLEEMIDSVLEKPEKLAWIDFSFNNITELDDVIYKYPELSILYLHGNNISSWDSLFKLRKLKKLRTLTLHGNPISDEFSYRPSIIAICSQIINLDFTPITKSERIHPSPPNILKRIREFENPSLIPPSRRK